MTTIDLPYFGQIDFTHLAEYYSAESIFNGRRIRLDLNFENKSITEDQAKYIKLFLDNISAFEIQNKLSIDKDFNESGETFDYINFYQDELDEEELGDIIDSGNDAKTKEQQLLSKLKLIRVGLYPDGKYGATYYGVFDYTIEIDGEPCNQLLVVNTKGNGDLDHITWES
ncbi:MAG TPA: DUF2004 domain-containing protein [Ferruginibacter sp.]|nr:DUF2004 domain-containing protein [Ferruginibacter sp.]HPH92163.1 DUF2004 domain-containing protein [Ferruginibacter sp.]